MMLTKEFWVHQTRNGEISTNLSGKAEMIETEPYKTEVQLVYRLFKKKYVSDEVKIRKLQEVRKLLLARTGSIITENDPYEAQLKLEETKQNIITNLQSLMNFFSEFSFSPNFRFCNTFAKKCATVGYIEAKSYVANYFALTDNNYQNAIVDKMNSQEFRNIVSEFGKIKPQKSINNRFKLYYGSQGTGKTTEAMFEACNNCTVCHSAMLPSDLMEDFSFDDGKAAFKPSQLCKAMTEGKTIVLDEINLLPFESLRFLQSILDGKASFVYKGQTIEIKDGFQIIGTMNLQVNGMVYALPEPLVDRASDLREFELTADKLLGAIL